MGNARFDSGSAHEAYKDAYKSFPNKCLPQSDSTTYTPMTLPLPSSACRQCNLGCTMQFNYANPEGWTMSAALVNMGVADAAGSIGLTEKVPCSGSDSNLKHAGTNANLLRFYPDNSAATPRQDIVFNGTPYQLQFIEIYSPPLHSFAENRDSGNGEGATTPPQYDVEIVLCHSNVLDTDTSGTSDTRKSDIPGNWVNVSVFAKQLPSFSLSQSFFYDLLTPILSANPRFVDTTSGVACNAAAWEDCLKDVRWNHPVADGGKTPSATSTTCTSDDSPAMLLQTKSYWSPYQVLPARKSFYTYKGEFPYAPCFYKISTKKGQEPPPVQWVVMDNSVAINTADFDHLRSLLQNVAGFNVGTNYHSLPPSTEDLASIAYNNGKMVSGNTENDKFYVKCEKKGDGELAMAGVSTPADLSVDRELSQIPGDTTAPPPNTVSTFFTPPTSVMSTLAFCLIVSIALFGMFAAANWSLAAQSSGTGDFGSGTAGMSSTSHSMTALLVLALLVMYCTALFTSSLKVGTMLPHTLIIAGAGVLCGGAASYYEAYDFGSYSGLVWWMIAIRVILLLGVVGVLIAALVVVVIQPAISTSSHIHQNYSFYSVYGKSPDVALFIGTRANVQVQVAGFNLSYGNDYTVAQRMSESLSGTKPVSVYDSLDVPTDSLLRIPETVYNPPPSGQCQNANSQSAPPDGTEDGSEDALSSDDPDSAVPGTSGGPLPKSLFESPTGYACNATGEFPASMRSSSANAVPSPGVDASSDFHKAYSTKLTDNVDGMIALLKDYNRQMQASSADPFGTFLQAYINHTRLSTDSWFAIQRGNNPKSFDKKVVGTLIMNTYPSLYLYLKGLKKTDLPSLKSASSIVATVAV